MPTELSSEVLAQIFSEAASHKDEQVLHGQSLHKNPYLQSARPDHSHQPLPRDLDIRLEIVVNAQREFLSSKSQQIHQLRSENQQLRHKNRALEPKNSAALAHEPAQRDRTGTYGTSSTNLANCAPRPKNNALLAHEPTQADRTGTNSTCTSSTGDTTDLMEFSQENSPTRPPLALLLHENSNNEKQVDFIDLTSPEHDGGNLPMKSPPRRTSFRAANPGIQDEQIDFIDLTSPDDYGGQLATKSPSRRASFRAGIHPDTPTRTSRRNKSDEWSSRDGMILTRLPRLAPSYNPNTAVVATHLPRPTPSPDHKTGIMATHRPRPAPSHDKNTAVMLTDLPGDITYQELLRALARLKPGRIKDVQIKQVSSISCAARVTFFTHEAARRVLVCGGMKSFHPLQIWVGDQEFHPSVSWCSKGCAPSHSEGRTRILMVRGPPILVNMANISSIARHMDFNPMLEDVIFTYLGSQGFVTMECRFRCVKDASTAKGIFLASLHGATIEYLPDSCE